LLVAFPLTALATNLRGQVQIRLPTGQTIPRAQALVEMFPQGYRGRAPFSTTTGSDGLYYFMNVSPGAYQIWINRTMGPYQVQVAPARYQDVAPILTR
jgi:hypothetical protein